MKKTLLFLAALLPAIIFAQKEFNNMGSAIYIQKGALITVQGEFINDNGTTNGDIKNDGIIEVKGNFENKANASFGVHTDNTSTDRAVKFTGNGKQIIKGNMSAGPGFYNLVVDKVNATDTLEIQTNINVNGSLVFGTATTTTTYNPTALYTNNNQKGIIKTFSGNVDAPVDAVLTIANGNTDAIAGYAAPGIDNNASTGFIVTRGERGTANGGLERHITSTGTYMFPIATNDNGYNAVALNFTEIPAGGGYVKGKFNDGTDNTRGTVGSIAPFCANCYSNNYGQDNAGYNRHFASNPCNGNTEQWVILENSITDFGYWSFGADANEEQYKYIVEVFPTSFTAQGNPGDTWRTVKYSAAFGNNPSYEGTDWTSQIEEVENIEDLITYSRNTGSCYTGDGVPGGTYTGFGQFAMFQSNSGNALPVEMLYIKAEAKNNTSIEVSWATALEINNSGFEVKRSTDGINFTTIGWVNGHGNSTTTETYSYNDKDVTTGVVYYYMLRQVDFDGASENSKVVSASLQGTATTATTMNVGEFMPNPAVDYTRILIHADEAQTTTIKVYDITGRIVSEGAQGLTIGSNMVTLDVTALASGTYTTVITSAGKSIAKNLVVAKN